MSYLVIRYKKEIEEQVFNNKIELNNDFVEITTKILNKRPEEVIIEYSPWIDYFQVPDILVRGETSMNKQGKLNEWSESLKHTLAIYFGNNLRLTVKTYSIYSSWSE